jgi:hypothetical protein
MIRLENDWFDSIESLKDLQIQDYLNRKIP